MRFVHFTDLHLFRLPRPEQLLGKRLLGATNLLLLGRRARFQEATLHALVRDVSALEPHVVVCTGDLTAMATPWEFADVRDLLLPLIGRQPFIVLPGNHDVYTRNAFREERFKAYFGQWTGSTFPCVNRFGDVAFVSLDVARFDPILSRGRITPSQVAGLEAVLASRELDGAFVALLLHYPLVDAKGHPYGPSTRALEGASLLLDALGRSDRVGLVLHGHEHHGFATTIPSARGAIPVLNPGAGGYAHLPAHGRTASFQVLDMDGDGLHGVVLYDFDGLAFRPRGLPSGTEAPAR